MKENASPSKTKMSIYDLYFKEQDKYTKIYGGKTIVFFQIGKFYESYCTKSKGYTQLEELEPLLNIKYIRRDQNGESDDGKPSQFGINCVAISKNLSIMIENGYTIVLFDQKTTDGDDIERECVGVFTSGTYIPDKQMPDANYLLSVYISEEKQIGSVKTLLAIGVSLVDVSTGFSMIHEFCGNKQDEKFGLEELVRIMSTFKPTESVIYFHPVIMDEVIVKNLKTYLELDKYRNCHIYIYHNKLGNDKLNLLTENDFKISHQNDYFSRVYEFTNQITLGGKKSAIELLNLEKMNYARISLLIMLKYICQHNAILLKNLSQPEIYLYHKHLILGNNAIEQLNVIDSNNLQTYNHKIESLFDVINKTSTPMGKRMLKENLLNPLSQENKSIILKRYELINSLVQGKFFQVIQPELKKIFDMERLHRKMAIGSIVPYEFYRLDLFYQATNKIIAMAKKHGILNLLLEENIVKDFVSMQLAYNQEYDFEKLQNYNNFNDIDVSFFKKNIHADVDKIQDKIDYVKSLIDCTNEYFTNLIINQCKKNNQKEILKLESNEREGYYFTINKSNEKILKEEISKKKGVIKIDLTVGKTLEIGSQDIEFKQLPKGRTKIFITPLIEHTLNLSKQITKLAKLIKKRFINSMVGYYDKYKVTMCKITKFIAEIDFLVSGAHVANQYYYCKPEIPSEEKIPSYFEAKALRHAIVERLCCETEYVPNDVELGNVPPRNETNETNDIGKNGILLYGLNSCGKSTTMKAIGIAIILAQIGYYVPAEKFVYEPYMALYARITGNDNIFKGLSSFALEMTELDAILMRTENQGPYTLVIGDEVCRGTEDISGLALVASSLVSLSQAQASFIFSSHLHDLPTIEEIKKLNNLRVYHLRVEYDTENDCLIFDRKMAPGSGPRVYGLTVAKYLIKNNKFTVCAENIKRRLVSDDSDSNNLNDFNDLPIKTSNYNNDLLVKYCSICRYCPKKDYHKELECHHIHFQKNCWEDGKIKDKPYLTKNRLYNLVILCRKCHTKVHQGEIIIYGYADTSIGPMLNYKIDIKKKISDNMQILKKFDEKINKERQKNKITHVSQIFKTE